MIYFFDSSALVKRYVTEVGSAWIQNLTAPTSGHTLIVARITWVELLSALSRLLRMQNISSQHVTTAIGAFRFDWRTQYQTIELTEQITQRAGQLVQSHTLRAYDAVQLASALALFAPFTRTAPNPFVFLSADNRLLTIAQAEGLPTDNPLQHP